MGMVRPRMRPRLSSSLLSVVGAVHTPVETLHVYPSPSARLQPASLKHMPQTAVGLGLGTPSVQVPPAG